MIPMGTATIFKNRWWAVLWAAGILWVAYDVAGAAPSTDGGNNVVGEDATGAAITTDDAQHLAQAINSI